MAFVAAAFALSPVRLTLLMLIGFYATATSGLNVLVGRLGLITIGHAASVGLAAFFAVYFLGHGVPFLVSCLAAAVVSTVIGFPLVLVSFRLDGLFFGIVSLAYLIVTMSVLHLIKPLSGGAYGVVTPPIDVFGHSLYDYRNAAVFVGVMTGLALGTALFATRTSVGLQWDAIRTSPAAAEALGISVARLRTIGYLTGTMVGSIAGPLYAVAIGALSTGQFGLRMSLAFMLISVIGRQRSIVVGPVVAAAVYVVTPEVLQSLSGSGRNAAIYAQMLLSVTILVILVANYSGAARRVRLPRWASRGSSDLVERSPVTAHGNGVAPFTADEVTR